MAMMLILPEMMWQRSVSNLSPRSLAGERLSNAAHVGCADAKNVISADSGHHDGATPLCLPVKQTDTNANIEMLVDGTPKTLDPGDGRSDRGTASAVSQPHALTTMLNVLVLFRHEVGQRFCSSVEFDTLSTEQPSSGHLALPSLFFVK
ncbi:hypothetical protein Nepgr_033988 [Nepenthes gracilis]|uniref:Uncharacterized protein n=1 Tax=Nepenthes gracilis TaxID=150966 RepID=A0AAD3Y921_NEPGR|nr:hypothetical protein Nepgr_033988 [Nepenthes gracilis]